MEPPPLPRTSVVDLEVCVNDVADFIRLFVLHLPLFAWQQHLIQLI